MPIFLILISDLQEFYKFMDRIRADGGGDLAEDVFGGLDAMLKLNWPTRGTKVWSKTICVPIVAKCLSITVFAITLLRYQDMRS